MVYWECCLCEWGHEVFGVRLRVVDDGLERGLVLHLGSVDLDRRFNECNKYAPYQIIFHVMPHFNQQQSRSYK